MSNFRLIVSVVTTAALFQGVFFFGFAENWKNQFGDQGSAPTPTAIHLNDTTTNISWDRLRLAPLAPASLVAPNSLCRLRLAMQRARKEARPLRLGVVGGSFAAGGSAPALRLAFPRQLQHLLDHRPGTFVSRSDGGFGAELVNLAQGASDYSLPMLCLEKVHHLISSGKHFPDVWVTDYVVNMAPDLDRFAAFVGSLLHGPIRSTNGTAAVIIAAVTSSGCLRSSWINHGCEYRYGNFKVHSETATLWNVPLVSWLHGVVASLPLKPPLPDVTEFDLRDVDNTTRTLLDSYTRELFAFNGTDLHFNEYGHRLHAEYLWNVFLSASQSDADQNCEAHAHPVAQRVENTSILSHSGRNLFSRLTQPAGPLACNLTLTQNKLPDLVPLNRSGYEMKAYAKKANFGAGWGDLNEKAREDLKRTWTPERDGAWIEFPVTIQQSARDLCVMTFGDANSLLKGTLIGKEKNLTCFFGGRGTPPLYTMVCNCSLDWSNENGNKGNWSSDYVLRLTSLVNLIQVAGVAVY